MVCLSVSHHKWFIKKLWRVKVFLQYRPLVLFQVLPVWQLTVYFKCDVSCFFSLSKTKFPADCMPSAYLSLEWPRIFFLLHSTKQKQRSWVESAEAMFCWVKLFFPIFSSKLETQPQKFTEKMLCATQLNIFYCFSLGLCHSFWLLCNAVLFICCHETLVEHRWKEKSNHLLYLI